MTATLSYLSIETCDGWHTEHPVDEIPRVEGDELVYACESPGLGRQEIRRDLHEIRRWTVVSHGSGLAHG